MDGGLLFKRVKKKSKKVKKPVNIRGESLSTYTWCSTLNINNTINVCIYIYRRVCTILCVYDENKSKKSKNVFRINYRHTVNWFIHILSWIMYIEIQ